MSGIIGKQTEKYQHNSITSG